MAKPSKKPEQLSVKDASSLLIAVGVGVAIYSMSSKLGACGNSRPENFELYLLGTALFSLGLFARFNTAKDAVQITLQVMFFLLIGGIAGIAVLAFAWMAQACGLW